MTRQTYDKSNIGQKNVGQDKHRTRQTYDKTNIGQKKRRTRHT